MSNTVTYLCPKRVMPTSAQPRRIESFAPCFAVSDHVLAYLYYPSRVVVLSAAESLFPLTCKHNADAVYENAMRFLETVRFDAP
ncbi:MAG: hypothetical protein AB7E52_00640 [Bdellovibrionales bacterium]